MNNPNIIFIVLDTLRADRVLCTYKNKNLTPFISSILDNSIYFENCIANSPWTLPSHISMFTGLYETQHVSISKNYVKLSQKVPILTEILKDMGYHTVCYTENPFISNVYGLSRGFDNYINAFNTNIKKNNQTVKIRHNRNVLLTKITDLLFIIDSNVKKRVKHSQIINFWTFLRVKIRKYIRILFWKNIIRNIILNKNTTIREINKSCKSIKYEINNKPVYFFFNIMTTHDPYAPLFQVLKKFDITLDDFKILKKFYVNTRIIKMKTNLKPKHLSENKIKTFNKIYNACVLSSDIIVKNIFSNLKKIGILDNAYVIITSDHGEHLFDKLDHYYWEHGTYVSLYNSVLRVPLLIFNTKLKKKIVKNQVQLIDLFHTILHLTRIPADQNKYLEINKSIIYQIDHKSTPKYIFGEYFKSKNFMLDVIKIHRRNINRKMIPKMLNHIYFLRSNECKYIKYNNCKIKEFFNLSKDPHEQNNIFNENNENCRKMKLFLENYLKKIKNIEGVKDIITEKEKSAIKSIINKVKI